LSGSIRDSFRRDGEWRLVRVFRVPVATIEQMVTRGVSEREG